MKVSEAIRTRRAVKHFDPAHQMSEVEIRQIIELTMLAPTAFNIQHWRFVLVQEPQLRQQIRTVSWNQAQVTDASLLVILTADLHAWEKNPIRYWHLASQPVQNFILPAIDQYYRGRPQTQRDEVMRSCGIAAQTLMLVAQEFGYDSCPMDGFDFDAVAKLINLPSDHAIAMFIAIGKAIQPPYPRSGPLQFSEVVIQNRFE